MELHLPTITPEELSLRDQRALILQLLYAVDSADYTTSINAVAENLYHGFQIKIDTTSDFFKKVQSIIEQRDELDEKIKPLLNNWKFERLSICTKLILRLAIWELLNTDINAVIIMNEAIEIAKGYAEEESYKFINGILDEWVKRHKNTDTENTDPELGEE